LKTSPLVPLWPKALLKEEKLDFSYFLRKIKWWSSKLWMLRGFKGVSTKKNKS
jgi:hypothetical protein